MEVITLVFGLAGSVAMSVGTQFEIVSLILLRQTLKEFTAFDEPVVWDPVSQSVFHMTSDAVGALLSFVMLGAFHRLQRHQPITSAEDRESFIVAKKLIALALLTAFVMIGLHDAWWWLKGQGHPFFEAFSTVLIFSDLLVVLISLRYSSTYRVVFRNSGFAAATVFMRLALTAPPYYHAVLGLVAVAFACAPTLASNGFSLERAEV